MRSAILPALSFLVGSLAQAQDQAPALIGYWHSWNDVSAPYIPLGEIDPRYNVIEVAFAEPVGSTTYVVEFSPSEETPEDLIAAIAGHKAQGKKVVISLGGANATIQLNTDQERDWFIGHVMYLFSVWGFNGLDLDLEGTSVSITGGTIDSPVDSTLIRLIDAVNEVMVQFRAMTGEKLFLTMAPETAYVQGGQSAFGGIWGAYLPIIHALRDSLDILQVQLYNSGSMYGIDGAIYEQGTADFIVSQTEAVIQGFNTAGGFFEGLPPEKVAVGLPACNAAAGGGYTDTATVRAAMEYLLGQGPQPGAYTLEQPGGYPDLRGMMTWSINWDAVAGCDGAYSYAENYERIFSDQSTGLVEDPPRLSTSWPNPVSDLLYLASPLQGKPTIHDLSGKVVLQAQASGGQGIDVRDLRPGTYVLRGLQDGRPVQERFVKL